MYISFLALLGLVGVAMGMGGVHILPMRQRQSLMEKKMLDGTWADYVKEREMRNSIIAAAGGSSLQDYSNTLYDLNICLGTPPQGMKQMCFRVIPDTGSANLWVVSSKCGGGKPNCPSYCTPNSFFCSLSFSSLCPKGCCSSLRAGNPCANKNEYNGQNSTTYQANGQSWSIQYGTGSASGVLDSDILSFPGTSLKDRVTFGEATTVASFFAGQPLDGIMGMAFTSLAVDHIVPPFIKMLNDGLFSNPVFTFWLTDLSGAPTGQNGGQLTFGGYDSTHCSMQSNGAGLTWISLSSATYYQFALSGVSAAGYSNSQSQQAILDTGTSLIAGPQAIFDGIGKALGGTFQSSYGVYTVPCNFKGPAVSFTINGKTYSVASKNYVLNAGQNLCYLGFQPFSSFGGPSFILGDVFIRQYCSVFDVKNNRIGLAAATQ